MDSRKDKSPLCHGVGSHRAVNAAGDQDGGLAARAHRQSAGAAQLVAVDVGALLAHLDVDDHVRVVDIH